MKVREEHDELFEVEEDNAHFLILHNDEINTFDFVVESLIKVCEHEMIQAEQCATIAHLSGKCDVKKGAFDELKSMKDALIIRGLSATID